MTAHLEDETGTVARAWHTGAVGVPGPSTIRRRHAPCDGSLPEMRSSYEYGEVRMSVAAKRFASRRAWSELYVARRYLQHGFVDIAMRLLLRNATQARRHDWKRLVRHLMAQGRIEDAVGICERSNEPLARAELLALGDHRLRLRDVDGAMRWFEVAGADSDRWSRLVDVLTALPGRELQALAVAKRYLTVAAEVGVSELAAAV
jgi:hypothetical protein